jgi:hypothetical protein
MIKRCLLSIIVPVLILSFAGLGLAQQAASPSPAPIPPAAQQAINQGQVTPQQVQEGMKAVERGQISPEAVKQLQEKGGLGTLTPQEIEAGKKMLEQKTKEAPKPKAEEKAPAELKRKSRPGSRKRRQWKMSISGKPLRLKHQALKFSVTDCSAPLLPHLPPSLPYLYPTTTSSVLVMRSRFSCGADSMLSTPLRWTTKG